MLANPSQGFLWNQQTVSIANRAVVSIADQDASLGGISHLFKTLEFGSKIVEMKAKMRE